MDLTRYGLQYGIAEQGSRTSIIKVNAVARSAASDTGQLLTVMEGKKFDITLPDIRMSWSSVIAGDSSQPVILGGIWSARLSPEPNETQNASALSQPHSTAWFRRQRQGEDVVRRQDDQNMVGIGNSRRQVSDQRLAMEAADGEKGRPSRRWKARWRSRQEQQATVTAEKNIKINANDDRHRAGGR
jgi:hypothetical protein